MIDKSCQSVEFYTPTNVLRAVRDYFAFLGGFGAIDCDPATPQHNPTQARVFYTQATDGLAHEWGVDDGTPANVFVNPPYGEALYRWVPKIDEQARRGHRIVALLPGQRFDQLYWQDFLFTERLTALVLVTGRLAFVRPDGKESAGNPYGSMLYCYNGTIGAAAGAFRPLGMVVQPGSIHPWTPDDRSLRSSRERAHRTAVQRLKQGRLFEAGTKRKWRGKTAKTTEPQQEEQV